MMIISDRVGNKLLLNQHEFGMRRNLQVNYFKVKLRISKLSKRVGRVALSGVRYIYIYVWTDVYHFCTLSLAFLCLLWLTLSQTSLNRIFGVKIFTPGIQVYVLNYLSTIARSPYVLEHITKNTIVELVACNKML